MKEEAHAFCHAGSFVVSAISLGVVVGALTSASSPQSRLVRKCPDTVVCFRHKHNHHLRSGCGLTTNGVDEWFDIPYAAAAAGRRSDGLSRDRPARERPRAVPRCRRDR